MTSGYSNHFDGTPTTGVLAGVADNVLMCDPNDVAGITRFFSDHKDIAAVILEPTGANFGKMPILTSFLAASAGLTKQAGTMLIFDEVVTGFRVSPGGLQAGDRRDAGHDDAGEDHVRRVAGRGGGGAQGHLGFARLQGHQGSGKEKIAHQGTFNANPVSAAAGSRRWRSCRPPMPVSGRTLIGEAMRRKMNEVLEDEHVNGRCMARIPGCISSPTGRGGHRAVAVRCGAVRSADDQ